MYASLAAAPGGPIFAEAPRIMANGDRRFGIPPPNLLFTRTIDEVATWVKPQLEQGPIELSIFGDSRWEAATEAVAKTLGALPARSSLQKPFDQTFNTPKPRTSAYVYTTAPQLSQVAVARFCPIRAPFTIHQERRCRMLAELMTERLRLRLREEFGAAYNSSASLVQYEGFKGLLYFILYAEVSSSDALRASKLIKNELDALRKKQFTDDEFARIKAPFLRHRDEDLPNNSYWTFTVLRDAQQRPERLNAARDRSADTVAITRRDLEKLAKRHLDPARSFEFVAYPAPTKAEATEPTFPLALQ